MVSSSVYVKVKEAERKIGVLKCPRHDCTPCVGRQYVKGGKKCLFNRWSAICKKRPVCPCHIEAITLYGALIKWNLWCLWGRCMLKLGNFSKNIKEKIL